MPYVGQKPADIIATAVDTTTGKFSGVVDADAGITVDNITIDGTEIDLSSGDLTLDVAGDIILDADGGDIKLKDGSTIFGELTNNASADGNLDIKCPVSDADIRFKGNDGGSTITALRLDMSDAGTAVFGHDLKVADNNNMQFGSGPDLMLSSDGTNGTIENQQSNGDILFKGSDAGSTITALTLDMSDLLVEAIFNSGLAIGGTGDANTLEDYEEGTHGITFTNISANPSSQGSTYTKIGNVVNYVGTFQFPNTSDTNEVRISLPFVSTAKNSIGVFLSNGANDKILFTGGDGTNYMRVYPDNSFTQNTYNQFSTLTFYFTITYQTTA